MSTTTTTTRRTVSCGFCQETGHNRRTCPHNNNVTIRKKKKTWKRRIQYESKDYDCSICFEDCKKKGCELECGHRFHTKCLFTWLSKNDTCPNCRAKVPELKKTNVDNKDYYVLSYKNAEYQTIFDIHSIGFYATEAELEYLFNELKKGFKSKEELKLNIGKTTIMFRKFMKSNIYISNLDGSGSWFSIPPNLFYELFGKKYDKKEFKSYLKS